MHKKILRIELTTKKYDISNYDELYNNWMGGTMLELNFLMKNVLKI
ncbi:MAG TPA: hypothetical protein PL110_07195 [Candidatus Eremiobacteraeota bacterium]|nr:MAG: hypothetical protein BWY64_02227 [bacterium ADurb.Bin363]HPZ07880.1 hypothetical protein [Candidatus Eremiobacteraeota bacterium]